MTTTQASQQSPALRERVLEVVRAFVGELRRVEPGQGELRRVDPRQVREDSHFRDDLELDSLDLAALAQRLEEEFGLAIDDESVVTIHTVGEALDLVVGMVESREA